MARSELTARVTARAPSASPRVVRGRLGLWGSRIIVIIAFLLLWQYLPQWRALRSVAPASDPYFLSSPVGVAKELRNMAFGTPQLPKVWPYLAYTLEGTFIGGAIAVILGMGVGLAFSNSKYLSKVFSPFIAAMNAVPRIALIPIFVIIFGLSLRTSVVTAIVIVFFGVFYNAYYGGMSVPPEMLQNAKLLGASGLDLTLRIRSRYVLVWTFATLPNAISLALISVVTAEILGGSGGMGSLILQALSTQNAQLTFAVVVILAIVGIVLVSIADVFQRRLLHWFPGAGRAR
jgi:NitT/TauT family transport system permease protein